MLQKGKGRQMFSERLQQLQDYLATVKEGDEVYIDPGHRMSMSAPYEVQKVVRVTKTQIRVARGECYRKDDGRRRAWDGRHTFQGHPEVVVPTDAVKERMEHHALVSKVRWAMNKLDLQKLPIEVLRDIARMLDDASSEAG